MGWSLRRSLFPLFLRDWGGGLLAFLLRGLGGCCGSLLLIAVVGWVAGTQVEVVSDIARLAPADLREVRDLKTLQREAGTSGDVNVLVRSERLLDPEVVRMDDSVSVRGPAPARLQREAAVLPGGAVSGAVAHQPVRVGATERAPGRAGDRGAAALLLAERHHGGPPHGQHRVPASARCRWTSRRSWSTTCEPSSTRRVVCRRSLQGCPCSPRTPMASSRRVAGGFRSRRWGQSSSCCSSPTGGSRQLPCR